jgi:Family of unknown function (DUF6049)
VTRRRGLLSLFGLICASLVVLVPAPVHAVAEDDSLQLISQNFNIPADGSLNATIALPTDLANSDLSTTLIVVTVEQRVERREDLGRIINRSLQRKDDLVAISPICCLGAVPGQYAFSIPLEIAEIRADALSIPRTGLYPVTIAIQRDGRIVESLLTFMNRLPAVDEESGDTDSMSVAMAIGTRSAVELDSTGTTSLDEAPTIDEMTKLADTLDALDANSFPATVRIAPEVLNGLQALQPSLFKRLIASLQRHQVLVDPQWPIDASVAAAAGQQSLYTSWLRAGQAKLTSLGLGPAMFSRSTIFADQPVSDGGATLRRDQGAGLMVMTPDVYETLDGTIGRFSQNRGELIDVQLSNKTGLDGAVVDDTIANLLVEPMATTEQTRIYVLAHLLALRQKLETEGALLQRHSVVMGTPEIGVPDAALVGSITALMAETPGLAAATLDDVALHTDRLIANGEDQPVTLTNDISGAPLQKRIFRQASLRNEINSVASMLPADSDLPRGWNDLADLLPTTALDDLDAETMDDTITAELGEVRDSVQVPTAYNVNLPGRQSTVRVRLVNTSDVPLQVKVQLTSPSGKLVFANDPEPVVLQPGVSNIPIAVKALSNGTSGVSLDVSTPNDDPIGETIPLQFRVNALGVGNVLTFLLFSLVLLWWLIHMRSTRRKHRQPQPATLLSS